ncbi:MAG: AGE family epimerase/isomerase [Treponema sp.]|nr:AGE family epimerase/isomerase [Treponema sp.]
MDANFFESIRNELKNNILPYWEKHSRDTTEGKTGFFGKIDNDNSKNYELSRSIVMTSRFLWAYSAAARFFNDSSYLEMADFAYDTIVNKFFDKKNGGVYWSVMPDGTPDLSKKQIYGEAFCSYGLSEYAAALVDLRQDKKNAETAMDKALNLFDLMEKCALDRKDGGYIEACAEDWTETDDMRLSSKDMNCAKSMNTNLHVMEAYTNIFRTLPVVKPEATAKRTEVGTALKNLIRTTNTKIRQSDEHLGMFFNMDWSRLDTEISYGHDIEASWLLWEAACELEDEEIKAETKPVTLNMAEVALKEGMDNEAGAFENFFHNGKRDRTRVWWNQAEAVNGFYNAWEMTGEAKYSDAVEKVWNWVLNHQVDKEGGDWWAEILPDGKPNLKEPKGGNWKTAYHNARCCFELLRRSGN